MRNIFLIIKVTMMKKIIFFTLLFAFATSVFAQQNLSKPTLTSQDYLLKSKKQKTAAWVLLGGGMAFIGTGFLIGAREESTFDDAATGGIFIGVGLASSLASIPLFIASSRNKRKAGAISTQIEILRYPLALQNRFTTGSYPAVTLKMRI
jgi:hypothetical protein